MFENKIRNLLLKLFGLQGYLSFVSDIYIRLIRFGFFKSKYPELFYLKHLIQQGDVCIDIGANVGYYSVFLSKLVDKNGRIYAVEPVPLFANIFLRNTKKFALNNITLYQTALGADNKRIQMGTPVIKGVFRHGLTRVIESSDANNFRTFEAEMSVPDTFFSNLEKLNFVKCDVEGYEVNLFPHMMEIIKRFKPLIQIEISTIENREKIFDLFIPVGYKIFCLKNNEFSLMQKEEALNYSAGDFYFKA